MCSMWKLSLVLWIFAVHVYAGRRKFIYPEQIHNPIRFLDIPRWVNGSSYSVDTTHSPDWRLEEEPLRPWLADWYMEENRPYRLSPFDKAAYRWSSARGWFELGNKDNIYKLGCYCCTVYKRLIPLGTCGVITTRHIITTATSTELVLKDYDQAATLEGILGLWYDRYPSGWNSSMYMGVSRIHYHPRYTMPNMVNSSHPIPAMYDIAVWASTYPFQGHFMSSYKTYICDRAGAHTFAYSPPRLNYWEFAMVVGFQYMYNYRRIPMPFFKYVIKTKDWLSVCPKTEWGQFICLMGRWAILGLDSGCVLHRNKRRSGWLNDGLMGLNAFSSTLRSRRMTHYFTPVDVHVILEFLYDAYNGLLDYRYLDGRFYDTQWRAPVSKPWFYIYWDYTGPWSSYWDDPARWQR